MAKGAHAILALLGVKLAGHSSAAWAGGANQPQHLRVVLASPCANGEFLRDEERGVRLWWDEIAAVREPLVVQVQKGRNWREIGVTNTPGWLGPPLMAGQRLRVGSETSGWSEVEIPLVDEPAELSCLRSGEGGLAGTVVGDLAVAGESLWITSLGGGLSRLDASGVQLYTREHGLPSNEVIAVSTRENMVLAGTAAGAVLLVDGVVRRVFSEGLPGVHVQATLLDPWGGLWFGTDRGLAYLPTLGSELVQPIEGSGPVYTLVADQDGVWVGSNGLERVTRVGAGWSPRSKVEGGPEHAVYSILGPGNWFTGPGGELWQHTSGGFESRNLGEELLDIEQWKGQLVVAAGNRGLLGMQLDGPVASKLELLRPRTVVSWNGGLAIGTDSGLWWLGNDGLRPLALPRPLAAGQVWRSGLSWGDGHFLGGTRGVIWIGPESIAGNHLELASRYGGGFTMGEDRVYNLDRDRWLSVSRRGRLEGGEAPTGAQFIAERDGVPVFAGERQVCASPTLTCLELGQIQELQGGRTGVWVVAGRTLLRLEGERSWPAADVGNISDLLVDHTERVWIASSRGLEWRARGAQGLEGDIVWAEGPLQALAWGDKQQRYLWLLAKYGRVVQMLVQRNGAKIGASFDSGLPAELVRDASLVATPKGLFILSNRGVYFLRFPVGPSGGIR